MTDPKDHLRVFYDGACPSCVKDREPYERLAGKTGWREGQTYAEVVR